jgi:3-phosphoshikimate 1-carboxyvinyltransferase
VSVADAAPSQACEVMPGTASGSIAAPASKSLTNRLLALAALAEGESMLAEPLESDDTAAMRAAVAALGAETSTAPGQWRVAGTGGKLRSPPEAIDAGLSGTTLRFATALASLTPAGALVTGAPPLRARPVEGLAEALAALGATVTTEDGYPPVRVAGGGLPGGTTAVDVSASSQHATAVLLAAPYADRDVTVRATGRAPVAYIELTAELMGQWGVRVHRPAADTWAVPAGGGYHARDGAAGYDASAAAHLMALAAATGGAVTVTNAAPTGQPDASLPRVLAEMGCRVTDEGDGLTVAGPDRLHPVTTDLSRMPDQVTTVAVLAALAEGRSTLTGVSIARGHESDRPAALAAELRKLGVAIEESADRLDVRGGTAHGPARLATHDDHRLAMAFAAVGARVPGVVVESPGCVAKTYPDFWTDLRRLGIDWRALYETGTVGVGTARGDTPRGDAPRTPGSS